MQYYIGPNWIDPRAVSPTPLEAISALIWPIRESIIRSETRMQFPCLRRVPQRFRDC